MSKKLLQKIFGSKRIRPKKVVVHKNVAQKIKDIKKFGSKKILSPKKFWVQKNYGSKKILGMKKVWV